ncbi:MAG: deoxyribonuclease IV [Candidatus Paceibacterota bacterium]
MEKINKSIQERGVGCHVSASGGLMSAIMRAQTLEINTIQLFGASPVQWRAALPTKEDANLFKKKAQEAGVKNIFLHAPYLINITSPKEALRGASQQLLTRHLEIAGAIGAQGVIFHVGSRGDMDRDTSIQIVIKTLRDILESIPESTLIMENNAGAGNLVGDTLEELSEIYKGVNNKRFGICIDTAHAFASGMLSLFQTKEINDFINSFDSFIGLDAWWVTHLNDSKVPAGSKKDRHENIGEGCIGKKGLHDFITHTKIQHIPLILEVPGFDGTGPDKKNLDIIKSLLV